MAKTENRAPLISIFPSQCLFFNKCLHESLFQSLFFGFSFLLFDLHPLLWTHQQPLATRAFIFPEKSFLLIKLAIAFHIQPLSPCYS